MSSLSADHRVSWPGSLAAAAVRTAMLLLVLHLLLFGIFDMLPDAAIRQLGWAAADPHVLDAARDRLGLSGPWYARYVDSLTSTLRGDLGYSLTGRFSVRELLVMRVRTSLPLWALSLALLILIPLPAALYLCNRHLGRVHHVVLMGTYGLLVPQFLTATILHAFWLVVLRHDNLTLVSEEIRMCCAALACALMPVGLVFLAAFNTLHDCLSQPYCTVYESLGLSSFRIRCLLVRNLLLATQNVLARAVLLLITGTVFAELLFDISGVGNLFVEAMRAGDVPVMQGWILCAGTIVVVLTSIERVSI